jgi:fructose-1,6-bisphosphatase I
MALDRYPATLAGHLFRRQAARRGASGQFSTLLSRIDLAARVIAREINRAGLGGLLGGTGEINVQGEAVQKLDDVGNQTFLEAFRDSGLVCAVVSEEMEDPYRFPENCPESKYVLCYDPVDGSSNIDVDITIGTIFSIRPADDEHRHEGEDEFLRPGTEQIAAGYVVYGPSTMLVYADDESVDGFTLDRSVGEFFLTHPNMRIPEGGTAYSVNEANWDKWSPNQQRLVERLRIGDVPGSRQTARYVGSLVADVHRTLLKGGIYMYPGEARKPEGKLRLLYEAAPLAFVVERAGGTASDGSRRILEKTPQRLHERTPLFIGNQDLVEFAEKVIAGG